MIKHGMLTEQSQDDNMEFTKKGEALFVERDGNTVVRQSSIHLLKDPVPVSHIAPKVEAK